VFLPNVFAVQVKILNTFAFINNHTQTYTHTHAFICILLLHLKCRLRTNPGRLETDGRDLPRYSRLIIGVAWYIHLKVPGERGRETVADSASRPQPAVRTAAPFFCAIRYNCRGLVTFAVARAPQWGTWYVRCPCPALLHRGGFLKETKQEGYEGRDAQRGWKTKDQKRGAQCRLSPQLRIFLSSQTRIVESQTRHRRMYIGTRCNVISFPFLEQGCSSQTWASVDKCLVTWSLIWLFYDTYVM